MSRPRGLMDKASDFGSEDCRFESCRGRFVPFFFFSVPKLTEIKKKSFIQFLYNFKNNFINRSTLFHHASGRKDDGYWNSLKKKGGAI